MICFRFIVHVFLESVEADGAYDITSNGSSRFPGGFVAPII